MKYINFSQIRSFYAVATTGNVTEAAKLLNVSQPTVSTQLKQLEARYDVELVYRMHRGVKLSPLGTELHRLTKRIFALEEEALELFASTSIFERGDLAVGTVGPHFVMHLLAQFKRAYPGIRFLIQSGNSEDIVRRLLNFEIDVGVVGNVEPNPELNFVPLNKADIVLVAGESHPWFRRRAISLNDLEGIDLIIRERGSETRRVLEDALRQRGVTPNIAMEVDRDTLVTAACEGLGVGAISEAEFVHGIGLNIVRIRDHDIYTEAFAVCLKEREERRLIRAFLEIAADWGDPADTGG